MIKHTLDSLAAAIPFHIIIFTLLMAIYMAIGANVFIGALGYIGGVIFSALVLGWAHSRWED